MVERRAGGVPLRVKPTQIAFIKAAMTSRTTMLKMSQSMEKNAIVLRYVDVVA
jgi:hypothetical protein